MKRIVKFQEKLNEPIYSRVENARKIISSGVIVYYYHKVVFTATHCEKKTVFSSENTVDRLKKVTRLPESWYRIIIFFLYLCIKKMANF